MRAERLGEIREDVACMSRRAERNSRRRRSGVRGGAELEMRWVELCLFFL